MHHTSSLDRSEAGPPHRFSVCVCECVCGCWFMNRFLCMNQVNVGLWCVRVRVCVCFTEAVSANSMCVCFQRFTLWHLTRSVKCELRRSDQF